MNALGIIATCKAKPGREKELHAAILPLADMGRSRDGCLLYEIHRDREDPAHFVFYETWESLAALDAHRTHPDFETLVDKILPMLSAPFEVIQLTKIA